MKNIEFKIKSNTPFKCESMMFSFFTSHSKVFILKYDQVFFFICSFVLLAMIAVYKYAGIKSCR